ncbi:MAG: hypothetical protein KGI29_07320, partial [Pseudomonadota bacterium]|nr:hypothetical protein [Pseudomonadota bacterium]
FFVQRMMMRKSIEHPFGIGPGQVEIYMADYFGDALASNATHNSYIRVWVENGLLSLFCFGGFLLCSLWLGMKLSLSRWRHTELSAVAFSVLCSYVLVGFVIDTIHWRQLWITCGIILALGVMYAADGAQRPRNIDAKTG